MLGSNQRPLPCEGSVMVCSRFLEVAKLLQIDVFCLLDFSQYFRRFTRVAARLLMSLMTEGGTKPRHRYTTIGTRHPRGSRSLSEQLSLSRPKPTTYREGRSRMWFGCYGRYNWLRGTGF